MSSVSEHQHVEAPQWQAPQGDPKAAAKAAKAYAKAIRPWYKKKRYLVPIGIVAVVVFSQAATGGTQDVEPAASESETAAQTQPGVDEAPAVDGKAAAAEEAPAEKEPEPKPEPVLTAAQENAVRSAEGYLDYTAFSRSGLIEQLEFEGYKAKDATFAVDSLKADWNAQAAKSAKDYLDYSAFSRSGLIEQLEFEGYTHEQAVYGVNQTGL